MEVLDVLGNRISTIIDLIPSDKWRHVTGFGKTLHMGSARDSRNARF